MTSTVGGSNSPSHGWINRELIEAGRNDPHINAYGGEDRFWLGPEGGQFSIFFKTHFPTTRNILLFCEDHTRNLHYLENVFQKSSLKCNMTQLI